MELSKKIDHAIKLLQSIPQDGPIELSYSGGKDSDVILELTKMSGIPFEAIYKNTTIDPPGTIAHCKENGVTILKPKMTFLQIVEQKGTPSRFARFCCEILKEYKVYDRAIQGIRRCESTARAKRYKEPEICRTYSHGDKVRIYLPILEWTDADVAQFIKDRNIKCAPVYYDRGGNSMLKDVWVALVARLHIRMDCGILSNTPSYSVTLSGPNKSSMIRTRTLERDLTGTFTIRFISNSFARIWNNTGGTLRVGCSRNKPLTRKNFWKNIF